MTNKTKQNKLKAKTAFNNLIQVFLMRRIIEKWYRTDKMMF